MPGQQRMIRREQRLASRVGQTLALHYRRRRMLVVEQGRVGDEALLAHEFLGVQVPRWTAEADVALARNLASHAVVGHVVSFDAVIAGPAPG